MFILRLEHKVQDYNAWKNLFDSDPIKRERSGVKRYTISRDKEDPNYIMIDLEFNSSTEAENVEGALRILWKDIEGKAIFQPRIRMVEVVETKNY